MFPFILRQRNVKFRASASSVTIKNNVDAKNNVQKAQIFFTNTLIFERSPFINIHSSTNRRPGNTFRMSAGNASRFSSDRSYFTDMYVIHCLFDKGHQLLLSFERVMKIVANDISDFVWIERHKGLFVLLRFIARRYSVQTRNFKSNVEHTYIHNITPVIPEGLTNVINVGVLNSTPTFRQLCF